MSTAIRIRQVDLGQLIIQAVAAIATAVAAWAAWQAATSARDSAQQGAEDLADERKVRRIEALVRLHMMLVELQMYQPTSAEWRAAMRRFRAARFSMAESYLPRCDELNKAWIEEFEEARIPKLLEAAVDEVERTITSARTGLAP